MNAAQQELLRALPSVDELLASDAAREVLARFSREQTVELVRAAIGEVRAGVLAGSVSEVNEATVNAALERAAGALETPSLRRVVNATGVVLHTNLGRSPLAETAACAAAEVARGYSTLEYNTETLSRGSRNGHCEHLICALTGAEAAVAVNNNAAAVMLVLAEFARGRAAVVSRGELVEIGGSFRIPDIMDASQARMVEVGTTNKTHYADYERALAPDVTMLLKVHPSNYRTVGFTEAVGVGALRALADKETERRAACGGDPVLVYEDLGSGSLVALDGFGEFGEPTVRESLAAGAHLVSFSGDKLLGGPQAGIIVGARSLIERLKKNPLMRAVRLDKMTLAALEATLRLYLNPARTCAEIPALRMLSESAETLRERAETLAASLKDALPKSVRVEVRQETSLPGGGALPLCELETFAVSVAFPEGGAQACERFLVQRDIPVICRCKNDALLFDVRTLLAGDAEEAVAALSAYCASASVEE